MTQQKGQEGGSTQAPKVVGPNIQGRREEYRLERRLQNGLFGGVYEARGLSSGRAFAVKVLHQSEIIKSQQADSMEFCEVPLSEINFIDVMRGSDHVMQVEDHFKDDYCNYIVFELAPGGDLLEALKLRPTGFEEHQAQFLIGQAAKGLAVLHQRHLAMQDVSLENMLINILEDGQYQIKICDPGQAIIFETDSKSGEELPVEFRGFVGKSFRPPELHLRKPYLASKVDAWCLGWSTFYLLAAQPLFLSADPAQQDADWAMFKSGEVVELFRQKGATCSRKCMDFILRLMQLDPRRRLSIAEALQHDWLADTNVRPMHAPKADKTPPAPEPVAKTVNTSPTKGKTAHSAGSLVMPGGVATTGGQQGTSQSGSAQFNGSRNSNGLSPDAGRGGRFRNPQPGGSRAAQAANASGRAPSRGQAPAWKMAPASRSESPSPGPAGGSALAFRQPQQQQVPRNASPFTSTSTSREENLARQLGTPRGKETVAPRSLASLRPGSGGSSTLQPAGNAHHSEPAVGLGSRHSGVSQYSVPTQISATNGSEGISSPTGPTAGYSTVTAAAVPVPSGTGSPGGASTVAEGHMGGLGNAAPVASRATSGTSGRQQQLGSGLWDSAGLGSTGGVSSASGVAGNHGSAGHRPSSPIPQTLIIRPGAAAGRGYSPGPMGTLGLAQRAGSPLQQHNHGGGVPAVIGGSRGAVAGAHVPIDPASGGHYWQSPRAGSPGSTVIRQSEAFARGRSATRASSPSQVTSGAAPTSIVNAYNGNPGGPTVVRPISPGVVSNVPARGSGSGFAWSPAPLSPPPNKRAVSPVPSPVGVVLTSSPVPRWVA